MHPLPSRLAVAATLLLFACNNSQTDAPAGPARFVLSADAEAIAPDPTATVPPLDYRAVLDSGTFGAVYRLTTPANEPFAFDLIAWSEGARGTVGVSVKHVGDGGDTPAGGLTSLARAGMVPAGTGLWQSDGWLSVAGDGFARLSLQGSIAAEQVLAVTNESGGQSLVVVAIGERSTINQDERNVPNHPSVASRETIYSSDAWGFGMPTIAVSGDRATIVAYEGDRELGMMPDRYELRMQHDRATGAVTGGGSVEASSDSGNWRDHEIAALHNVLVVARSERDHVRVKLSFDRGAAFEQEVLLPVDTGTFSGQSRLVQVAMALDYSLALVYWQSSPQSGALELRLCEGYPTAFDGNGSPTWFLFDSPEVLHIMPPASSPLLSGIAWSDGGDLVIGYGASRWETTGNGGWRSTTEFHCAVRRHGEPFSFREIEREVLVGYDPSVAVLGQGSSLRIFYAYEVRAGVRLAVSNDGGATFAIEPAFGGPGAHNPTVLARDLGGATALDVLYLANQPAGRELHHARWTDYGTTARSDHRLTSASMEATPPQAGRPAIWGFTGPYHFGLRTTQVNWLGYDAVLDGDQIVVVYDEVTQDAAFLCLAMWSPFTGGLGLPNGTVASPQFTPATPPPLAPGMTEPMPAVDPDHAHQLKLVRID